MDWFDKMVMNAHKVSIVSISIIALWAIDQVLPKSTTTSSITEVQSIVRGSKRKSYTYRIVTDDKTINTEHIVPYLEGAQIDYYQTILLRTVTQFEVSDGTGKVLYKGESISAATLIPKLVIFGLIVAVSLIIIIFKPKEDLAKLLFLTLTLWGIYFLVA